MTNLEWLASMSKEGARDKLETSCPMRRPATTGDCPGCAYYTDIVRCDAIRDATDAMADWLLEEHKPEDCP